VRRFVEQELLPLESQYGWQEDRVPQEIKVGLIKKVKDLGLWFMSEPVEYGGGGLSLVGTVAAQEEIGRALILREVFGGLNGVLIAPGLYQGTPEQKQKYLLPTMRGEMWGCWCLTEPITGSDPSMMATTALRDGDTYILTGAKHFISGADKADWFIVPARIKGTRGRTGITLFIVEKGTPGLTVSRVIDTMGEPSSCSPAFRPGEIAIQDCVVRLQDRIGEEGQGWEFIQNLMGAFRFAMGAQSVGLSERMLKMCVDYSKSRVTFGEPLARRQAIQFMLADSAIEIHTTRLLTYHGAWKSDQGQDSRQEISMIKVYASEMLFRVADRAIQIFGAMGVAKEMPLEKIFRNARCDRIVEGPNEIHRWVIARNLLRN
jgi:acyl-CoA dehydrogenase